MSSSITWYTHGTFHIIDNRANSQRFKLISLNEGETWWWVESSGENVEGQFKVTGVIQDQMAYHCCMDLKLSGWSHFLMPTFLKGQFKVQ